MVACAMANGQLDIAFPQTSGQPAITFEQSILVQRSVAMLQRNAPRDGRPYFGAFSGGKDSLAIKLLAEMAGVKVEWHYHVTTIDPPELVRYIRAEHPDVIWDKPKHGNFFVRAERKGWPSRVGRWCCEEYKEGQTPDALNGCPVLIGVRIAESRGRAKRWTKCVMEHFATGDLAVLPIRLWSDADVWAFIRWRGAKYCSLYDEGWRRLGCIGCPLSTPKNREREWQRWPGFKRRWLLLFQRVWARRQGTLQRDGRPWFGSALFDSPEEIFQWWTDGQDNITRWREKHGLRVKVRQADPATETSKGGNK